MRKITFADVVFKVNSKMEKEIKEIEGKEIKEIELLNDDGMFLSYLIKGANNEQFILTTTGNNLILEVKSKIKFIFEIISSNKFK